MRIAIYHNLTSGGAKRSLFEQMKRMAGSHMLDVFTLQSSNVDFCDLRPLANRHVLYPFKAWKMFNSPFGRMNPAIRMVNLSRLRKVVRRMAMEIDRGGYDVLLVHPCQYEGCPSVLRFIKNTHTVYYCHEPLRIMYEAQPWRPYDRNESTHRRALNRFDPLPGAYRLTVRNFDQANIKSAQRVLVNSKYIQDAVRNVYSIESRISYHGVDAEKFRPLELDREQFVFSVGSITPLKGFDFLIEALATMNEGKRPPLVIASNFQNPQEHDYLSDLAGHKGVDLKLVGNISDERLVELYNTAAATVYAPVREPFGFVSLESMACATPVIAVAEGGLVETIIHGRTGQLVERDPACFGEEIGELLNAPMHAAELGRAGRAHVIENWTWERAVQTLESHLAFV